MTDAHPPSIVLVGAGHAHLHVLRHADRLRARGLGVTLIDPGCFWYSGLATGMLAGMYEPAVDRIDPAPLAAERGVGLIRQRLTAVDPARRLVTLSDGRTVSYAALSLNLGSEVAADAVEGAGEHAWPVKPIRGLAALRSTLADRFLAGRPTTLTVVGGGPTGCEIAAAVAELARRHQAAVRIALRFRSQRLIPRSAPPAARSLARALKRRGVELCPQCRIARVEPEAVIDEHGRRHPADLTVLATGLQAPRAMRGLDLPGVSERGLAVGPTLQSMADPAIFAVGDCADFVERPLPKLGVFGVRQGPVLLENLQRFPAGRPLRRYRPQKRWLIILNLGRGEGLAIRGLLHWRGRLSLRLKDRIDRRFLDRYRRQAVGAG